MISRSWKTAAKVPQHECTAQSNSKKSLEDADRTSKTKTRSIYLRPFKVPPVPERRSAVHANGYPVVRWLGYVFFTWPWPLIWVRMRSLLKSSLISDTMIYSKDPDTC